VLAFEVGIKGTSNVLPIHTTCFNLSTIGWINGVEEVGIAFSTMNDYKRQTC
jgi:hypothetical protein